MKKFLQWIKSPASDFALFVILLVLANIAFKNAHLRFDITQQGAYSLSEASKRTVKTLTEPLSVKVFFSDNLPTGYSKVYQYVKDILVEYKGAANRNFSYTFFDMNKPENQKIAAGYGLRQIQIQEVKNNEVGFKQVWMGLAITYGDSIEVIDGIQSESGFEYNLTTKIAKIISTTDALAGLGENDKITVSLYASDDLKQFRINGFDKIDATVQTAFNSVNKKTLNRLNYIRQYIVPEDIDAVSEKYGLQTFSWQNKDGSQGLGIFGLVIEHGENFRVLPLSIQRSLFGYVISGTETLEESMNEGIQGLLAKVKQVGYIIGHDEAELSDENGTSIHFVTLLSDMYELKKINLADEAIPANLTSIIVNGPKSAFSEEELYKIDQFVMRGGNVMLFCDPFNMEQQNYYQPATFTPIATGLNRLLSSYGIQLESAYVFDENCYKARQQTMQGIQSFDLYWAPMMSNRELNQKNPITKNLGYVIFLQPGKINTDIAVPDGIKRTVLAHSSEKSWTQSQNIQLTPNIGVPYDKSTEKSEALAVLAEGKFKSAFDKNPAETESGAEDGLATTTHISQARQSGKIFVAGTSYITSNQLIDENCSEPVALFVRNAVDYMNGNADLCSMRTKGVSFQTIDKTTGAYARFVEYFCMFGLALLIIGAGLFVWRKRTIRRRKIHSVYNPNDSREITK